MSRAVVYVRVSSQDQVNGFSLDVQERVCRDYAERQGWAVAAVYREEGESAKTADRRELQRALGKLAGVSHFLVYDLTRLSRDVGDYVMLSRQLCAAGVRLVAVTQPIEETPTGRFLGNVLAATGQLDNEMRREKTVAGMREAIRRGVWPWQAPLGYLSSRDSARRAILVHDPETAPLVALAFERIASGAATQEEIRADLAARGLRVPRETFSRLIHHPIYCGRIVAPKWGVEGRLASRPIVSEETFRRAQEALAGSPSGWKRSYLRPEFPLRWWTRCGACARPLTGFYGRGNGGAFPYYRCPSGCLNAARDRVHEAFAGLLEGYRLAPGVWRLWEAVLGDVYETEAKARRAATDAARRRLRELDAKEERLVSAVIDRLVDGDTARRMRARIAADRTAVVTPDPLPDFKPCLAVARRLAESPRETWDALRPEARPGFLRVAFPARLDYRKDSGFQTPAKSLYLSNLTQRSGPSCEQWYPRRGGLSTADGVLLFTGWSRLGPLLQEDQCQIAHP